MSMKNLITLSFYLMLTSFCIGDDENSFDIQINDDVLGLIVFKSDIHDPSSYLSSWNEDDDSPCSWKFIQCNLAGRVFDISLDGLGLSGKIGRGLEKLEHLKVLSLSRNNFTASSKKPISLPSSLESLNLSYNGLSEPISSISTLFNMSSIKFLDLSENSLSGSIPNDMFETCSSLHLLSLANNMLEGPIPSTLTKCQLLNSLNISYNHFSENPNFSSWYWSLKRLRTLDLSNNALSGSLPIGISAIHSLKVLLLKRNHFSETIPADIGLCPHLGMIDFSDNLLIGSLPQSLQRLTSLTFLSMSNNILTGNFPTWIGKMTSLEYLDFSNNGFMGSLPLSIGDLKSISYLSLSNNKLSGSIPISLGYCTKLSTIQLSGNSFVGSIPEGVFDGGVEEIDLSNNELSGFIPIPTSSSQLFESLLRLDLSNNNIKGNIPPEIGLFSRLRYLNLSLNNLDSRMPPELGYSQNLTVLDLQKCGLYGSIPVDLCESSNLGILQLDGNSLAGQTPEELGNCSSLSVLTLSQNNLSGLIPKTISKLKKLNILRLEFNKLSGEIPKELASLQNLVAVNISYNRLEGRLPNSSVFQRLDQTALQGNLGLCSPLLKGPCMMNVPKPLVLNPNAYKNNNHKQHGDQSSIFSSKSHNEHMFFSVSTIVAISAASLIAMGVVVIILLNMFAKKNIQEALEMNMCSGSLKSGNPHASNAGKLNVFDPHLSSACNISSPVSLLNKGSEIGEGVFGTVYKVLISDAEYNRVVAIKKLSVISNSSMQYAEEEFNKEVHILGKARHQNLIELKGYYWTPSIQLLLTEYAPNGSLQDKLDDERLPPLSWGNRFKILVGTANGLAHLHNSFNPPIIHYNIKPSNILLDENYNAKISDFGLTKLVTKLDKHAISNRFQSAPGYAAPELACHSLRVTEKCDVFSFGVLILQLVSGRRPIEYGEENVVILSDHARVLVEQGNVVECVDSSIGDKYPEDEVLPLLKLALVCTSQMPSSRPSMVEVVQILQFIKTPVPQKM